MIVNSGHWNEKNCTFFSLEKKMLILQIDVMDVRSNVIWTLDIRKISCYVALKHKHVETDVFTQKCHLTHSLLYN